MAEPSTPFPLLEDPDPAPWQWPAPPFRWDVEEPALDTAQPCRLETAAGAVVQGEMLGFDVRSRTIGFRSGAPGPVLSLPFERFVRLTLTTPLKPLPRLPNRPIERVPSAAQEREYRLSTSSGVALTGRSAGHVAQPEGLYLFEPVDEDRSLLRVFVPASAYERCEFGPSAEELAAERWIGDPQALLAAVERQQRAPVRQVGQALLDLGLVTQAQLERALARRDPDRPLGETLVADGVISRADLQTALAHKMGYPLVDLTRFPIDVEVARKLPHRVAVACRALPLLVDRDRLIVAVDRPSRIDKLRSRYVLASLTPVPVLAPKSHILLALAGLPQQDAWAQHVGVREGFFATTA